MTRRSINIAILAMGGEGGGVLADWLVDLAEHAGWTAQATSVPGVAQRTGATIYYVELLPDPEPEAVPVLALMPFPGDVDVVIASELMEAGRAVQRGFVTPDRTTFIASTHRVYSMTEKTSMGDGRVDPDALIRACRDSALRWIAGDFAAAAERNASVISPALFGALCASGALPFGREAFEEAIRRGGVGVDASLAAFAAGARLAAGEPPAGTPAAHTVAEVPVTIPATGPRLLPLAERIARQFPSAAHPTLTAGIVRLADYQDEAYAADYLDRLMPLLDIADPAHRLLDTTARHLALWMSYEDPIRVADLKTRRARFDRVRGEVRARDDQVLGIAEFMHPRVEEVADTLPEGLGRWLLATAWARRLVGRFFGHARVVRTSSLRGYLQLYAVASLRPMRRRSLRHREEMRRIAAWFDRILDTAAADREFAIAVAECQRLVKGYGDTHVRGWRNFQTLMEAAEGLRGRSDAAAALRRLRDAALSDEHGRELAAARQQLAA